MVFSSLIFLFRFLPIVLIAYFVAPRKCRNLILFLSSLVFYAWGEPIYVGLMLFSTVVDYTLGRLVDYYKRYEQRNKAKIFVTMSIVINLGLLGFFKYTDFFLSNFNGWFGTDFKLLNLALPIGISFYTFQTMSYTVDVYRGEAKVQKNIVSFGAYVALFPQLIAGPIVQYKTIATQLDERQETMDGFAYGVMRFMAGLGKKVLLANNIGLLYETIAAYPSENLPVLTAWLGAIAFAFQIYFDFSGYSDMAIGMGRMFGFHFLENFKYPYQANSITDFWRRWHISLGTWFKEYVYIPLGGNRLGKAKHLRNIMIVWLLTGFWHGASWNFLFWGLYFGVILMIEKLVLLQWLEKLPAFVRHLYTMVLVLFSWVIFAFEDTKAMVVYLKAMIGLGGAGIYNTDTLYLMTSYGVLLLILILGCTSYPKQLALKLQKRLEKRTSGQVCSAALNVLFVCGVFLLSLAYLVSASYNPFLYFRF